jgi:hypothetical protein
MNLFKFICPPRYVGEEVSKGGRNLAERRIQNAVSTLYYHPDGRAIEMTSHSRWMRGMVADVLWKPLIEADSRHQASGYIDMPNFYGIGCNMEAMVRDAFALVEEAIEVEEAEDRARWVVRLRAVEEQRAERVRRAAEEQAKVDAGVAYRARWAVEEQAKVEAAQRAGIEEAADRLSKNKKS